MADYLSVQSKICLKPGETRKLKWQCADKSMRPEFESNNPDVVTVDNDGNITAVSEGEADIITSLSEDTACMTSVSVGRCFSPVTSVYSSIVFAGNLICSPERQIVASTFRYDFTQGLEKLTEALAFADYRVGVLESTLIDGAPYSSEMPVLETGTSNHNAPSTYIHALENMGMDVLITANNHNMDCGMDGLKETVSLIKRNGISNSGTLYDNPIYLYTKNIKVAIISLNMVENDPTAYYDDNDDESHFIGRYSEPYCKTLIKAAHENGAEFIIVCMHWGSVHTQKVTAMQRETAQYIADCGADLIVGSHPHFIQGTQILHSELGKDVTCIYSLGDLIPSLTTQETAKDSAAFVLDLCKKNNKVSYKCSYLPFHTRVFGDGILIEPVDSLHGEELAEAEARIDVAMGEPVRRRKPHFTGIGSVITRRILSDTDDFYADTDYLLLSVPSFFGNGFEMDTLTKYPRINADVSKQFFTAPPDPFDFLIVDFYACASFKLLRHGDTFYSGTDAFYKCSFYEKYHHSCVTVEQPDATDVCAAYLKPFVDMILERYDRDHIILLRTQLADTGVADNRLSDCKAYHLLNDRIEWLEDLFMIYADPVVVDISGNYFRKMSESSSPSDYEDAYFEDVRNILKEISMNRSKRRYIGMADQDLWFERMLKYYNSMKDGDDFGRMCIYNDACDEIVSLTSLEFVNKHIRELIYLRKEHVRDMTEILLIDSISDELKDVAMILSSLIYESILPETRDEVIFMLKYDFVACKDLASILSTILDYPVSVSECLNAYDNIKNRDKYIAEFAHNKYHIDVWGSALSYELVSQSDDVIVDLSIRMQPQILAYDPAPNLSVPNELALFDHDRVKREIIAGAIYRNGVKLVERSKTGILVIDLYDLVAKTVVVENTFLELGNSLKFSQYYKKMVKGMPVAYLFDKYDKKLANSNFVRFAKAIKSIYGKNIILIRASLKDGDMRIEALEKILPKDSDLSRKREYLESFEELFISQTKCKVIELSSSCDLKQACQKLIEYYSNPK